MPDILIEFELVCFVCGSALDARQSKFSTRFQVDPCEECKQSAFDSGKEEGAAEAMLP